MQLQPVGLAWVVPEVLAQLDEEIRKKKAQVTVVEPLPAVIGHRGTLGQALVNLLGNAIKFVAPSVQPQIKIRAEEREESVRLWVEDNGIGIAPESQTRLFRAFERLRGTETYPGTGVGLAIVRKGVEHMGGRVGVESSPGQGSKFWIELPKAQKKIS
jgi:signal transduction histidine kinase